MKKLAFLVFITVLAVACNDNGDGDDSPQGNVSPQSPTVKTDSTYGVNAVYDLEYAQGLSHTAPNSADTEVISLKLDVYTPDNDLENRPLYMFIHGGGFVAGTKLQEAIVDFANYYTSRGWVFASIDYRVRDDVGTLPNEWLSFATNISPDSLGRFLAIYPAQRDAKAALRWLMANAETYGINKEFVTVGGGSAGGITAVALGVSEPEDFTTEISLDQDPTLATTNLNQSYQVNTVIDFWGSAIALETYQEVFGPQRFDSNDPPIIIIHGTEDQTVPFEKATELVTICETFNIPHAFYPLEGVGHAEWENTIAGIPLAKVVFDHIVDTQNLRVE